ncbi:MAG: hypothetical protein IPL95_14945 [Saprospiraceae bacterium]|nr:hypothetical protein [Saprospiraceae bacterium]
MNQKQVNRIIKLLKEKGILFGKGLSDDEIFRVNQEFGIRFPNDLKLLLQTEIPINNGFVNWRYGINCENGKKEIDYYLNWPMEGMLFDIKNNSFWHDKWGIKPSEFEKQKLIALKELDKQPKLIPIYSHRYISSEPNEIGNPVFSVYQMDIIYYGVDLMDYFSKEFRFELPKSYGIITEPKQIQFWSDIVDLNNKSFE